MLNAMQLPVCFWAEAISTAIYLSNLLPTKAVFNRTPYEVWYGAKPKVSYLKTFGCVAYTRVPSQSLQKFDDRAQKCIFIGYYSKSKAYRLLDPQIGKVMVSRDINFDEKKRWEWKTDNSSVQENIFTWIFD